MFFDANYAGDDYDPVEARKRAGADDTRKRVGAGGAKPTGGARKTKPIGQKPAGNALGMGYAIYCFKR